MSFKISDIPLIILAGGFGTRLRTAVADVPKPVAPIGNLPFLAYTIMSAYEEGIRHIILSLYHDHEKVVTEINRLILPSDLKIEFVVEPKPMGTGGAIRFAFNKLPQNCPGIFACNGDTYFRNVFPKLFAGSDHPSLALLKRKDLSRYGSIKIDSENFIESFQEKSSTSSADCFLSVGTYYFPNIFVKDLPIGPHSIEHDVFAKLAGKKTLKGVIVHTEFIDIGVPEDYESFKTFAKTQPEPCSIRDN